MKTTKTRYIVDMVRSGTVLQLLVSCHHTEVHAECIERVAKMHIALGWQVAGVSQVSES